MIRGSQLGQLEDRRRSRRWAKPGSRWQSAIALFLAALLIGASVGILLLVIWLGCKVCYVLWFETVLLFSLIGYPIDEVIFWTDVTFGTIAITGLVVAFKHLAEGAGQIREFLVWSTEDHLDS